MNDEYEILAKDDLFFKIQLEDGRQGWIKKQSAQIFVVQQRGSKIMYVGIKASDVKKFLDIANDIFSGIVQQKLVLDQILLKYKDKISDGSLKMINLHSLVTRINKYYQYSKYFYEQYLQSSTKLLSNKTIDPSRISAWGELLIGHANYSTKYLLNPEEAANKGMIRSISLGGDMIVDETSRVSISFNNRADIIQTPFSSTIFSADYSYRSKKKIKINGGFNFNSFNDDINQLNNFNRFSLRARADYNFSPKTDAFLNYSFISSSFKNDQNNNFSSQLILAGVDYRLSPSSTIQARLRTDFESSDSSFHKFSNLEPSISYIISGTNNLMDIKLLHQELSFKDLLINSYNRTALEFSNRSNKRGKFTNLDFALGLKSFPHNEMNNYLQLRGGFSTSRYGRFNRTSSASFFSYLFKNNPDYSFTDINFNFAGLTKIFFNNVSAYLKVWHTSGGSDGIIKPFVVDLYITSGLNTKYVRFGPTIGVHALLSSEKGVGLIKRDGNLLRFGGLLSVRLPLPKFIRLNFNASYDYGFVYSNEIGINVNNGNLNPGDVMQRHPTTLQVNTTIEVPISRRLELMGKLNYYRIDTDIDERLSIHPVEYKNRFIILFGVKYRYN